MTKCTNQEKSTPEVKGFVKQEVTTYSSCKVGLQACQENLVVSQILVFKYYLTLLYKKSRWRIMGQSTSLAVIFKTNKVVHSLNVTWVLKKSRYFKTLNVAFRLAWCYVLMCELC